MTPETQVLVYLGWREKHLTLELQKFQILEDKETIKALKWRLREVRDLQRRLLHRNGTLENLSNYEEDKARHLRLRKDYEIRRKQTDNISYEKVSK